VIRAFVKRNILWVGLLAVLVPLTVLLGLQYGWLVSLQQTSTIAHRAVLGNYLEAVSNNVEYFYYKQAWKVLNVPEEPFVDKDLKSVEAFFDKWDVKGARYLFAVRYTKDNWGQIVYYDPATKSLRTPDDVSVERATMVALAPWKTLAYNGASLQSHEISVDEKDPDNRIILKPISQYECKIVGVAGMIVDTDYFKESVLPWAIKKSLPEFFDHGQKKNLIITVRDSKGQVVLGDEREDRAEVFYRMPLIFTDWKLALASRFDTPEQLAKSNFVLNISMSVLLALVLLSGIVLALRTASREVKLSQMKSDFVSNVSHELRTPLASIRVFGEFLRLGRVKDEQKCTEYGEYIETESRRLTQLINNILDFSKIESGAKTYRLEPVDVGEVLADTLRTLQVSLRHQGFELSFSAPASPLPTLALDADAIGQAVSNLVDNAVKYSNGARKIAVELAVAQDEVTIAVADHGIGISRDEQRKIFDRFHRVSTGLVHDVKGSGLGLSIVNHIVKAHGGRVTVESDPGKGSTFRIHLPLRRRAHPAAPDLVPATIEPAGPLRNS